MSKQKRLSNFIDSMHNTQIHYFAEQRDARSEATA